MAENIDNWASQGRKNIFGEKVEVTEMQSEAGAAGAVHGGCAAGSLVSTYTASQGLLLMIPNMFKIAGEMMPCVFHVTARAIAGQALSIFGDHTDVMTCRTTGFNMLSSHTVQEVCDMALIAHVASLKSSLPFMHFFDGFRTSHEIQKINVMSYEDIKAFAPMEAIQRHRERGLNPKQPHLRGTSQGPDVYFQCCEASNKYYNDVPAIVETIMREFESKFGRSYHLFDYYGDADAESVVVLMGAGAPVCEEAADYLRKQGKKVGVVKVHLFRPFSNKHLIEAIPKTVKHVTVLERTKEPGCLGEPLYLDVCAAFAESDRGMPKIVGGRYGLGSKDFTPAMAKAVYDNMLDGKFKNHFTVGIEDDVTFTSLPIGPEFDSIPEGTTQCMFWGLGSDGTVGANHDAIRIIGDNTPLFVQGYFAYDAHKSGGVTVSHLRFGSKPIKSVYLIKYADYVACHFQNYVQKYKLLSALKQGGTFVLNCAWTKEQLEQELPGSLKREIAKRQAKFYIINAAALAESVGLGRRINMVMQSVFFKLANVIPYERAVVLLKGAIQKTYGSKGQKIVDMNCKCVDESLAKLEEVSVPASWAEAPLEKIEHCAAPKFVTDLLWPSLAMEGNEIPVSKFQPGGIMPMGTTKFEKRGIAPELPIWDSDKCIQCNMCSFVCPHAAIRPFLADADETAKAPADFKMIPCKAKQGYNFRIQVAGYDCTGCKVCSTACPKGAITMKNSLNEMKREGANWEYAMTLPNRGHLFDRFTVVGSQYQQPLLEFSGACEGCNETAYIKLITQLFGERMVVANATGCSSIWGGTWGTIPYTVNSKGEGPAWGNSLFEDNAEYGLGMAKATGAARERLHNVAKAAIDLKISPELKKMLEEWVANWLNAEICEKIYHEIVPLLEKEKAAVPEVAELHNLRNLFPKLSQWIFGGDGWAYDIGYGGLDHVIAQGVNLNVVVLDTEMYSNTGGQKSKATPIGAVAKFAAAGNRRNKKELGLIAMQYGDVYVASISLQANYAHALKAIKEAESYDGSSLVICYAPCREQGFDISKSLEEAKQAVASGYWTLYRYDPRLIAQGKNPFQLDSAAPSVDLKQFLARENRYAMLMRTQKEVATELQDSLKAHTVERYEKLKKLAADVNTLKAGVAPAATAAAAPAATAAKPNPMKRIPMKERPAVERAKDFNEVMQGYTKEEAIAEASRCLHCPKPRCVDGCPCAINIPEYIAAVKTGDFNKAFSIVTSRNPLIGSCGRVCPHFCEAKCIRGLKGEPLAIDWLKRAASDYGDAKNLCAPATGKKVAIVGSGPAGLVAAWHLALAGHKCTIFEGKGVAGGMMVLCIPPYRLPRDVLARDIERIKSLGVEIKLNSPINDQHSIDDLLTKDGFDAVFLGIGTLKPKKLGIEGEEAQGVEHVIPYLESVNVAGRKEIGKKVAVVGAGYSAMDAVRVARRLGSESFIVYRRERDQMPASKDEIHEAEEEGVVMHTLIAPHKIIVKDGKVAGLECIKQKLGAPDRSGRPAPEAIPGSNFVIDCDMVIQAISQEPDMVGISKEIKLSKWNTFEVDETTMATNKAKVWAAGDAVTGPKTIVEGVAATLKAVAAINAFLKQ
eukprot:TRINITY_DN93_c0_g1_i5.p1 TRINITY_DN93_c0_g1~~TRINITY_DN93_c0_g1_i5.p1  ORF type:complete len:1643 (-),score=495.73 TRINITY_DN93_c0_g1_i5:103-4890(-)